MKNTIVEKNRQTITTETSLGKRPENGEPISELDYWTRPTFYTPPRETKSHLPVDMFGLVPAGDIMKKLLKGSFSSGESYVEDICRYGWTKRGNQCYNVCSKEYSDKHVCC